MIYHLNSNRFRMLSALAFVSAVAQAQDNDGFTIETDGGISIEKNDGSFSFDLSGRLQWDTDSFDGVLNRANGGARRFDAYLRRSRIEMSGAVGENLEYVMNVNVFDGQGGSGGADIHDIGLNYTGFEHFSVFVGRGKEPFGLEELNSSKSITTIERNYFTEATDLDSQSYFGVRLDGMIGKLGWSTGLFNPSGNPQTTDGGDRFAWTSRVFAAPIAEDGRVLHFGLAYSDRNLDAPVVENGFKLDVAEGGGQLDSSTLLIDDDTQLGLEALYIQGAFSLQAEIFNKDMGGALGGPGGEVDAYYFQATWSPSGDARRYRVSSGIADIVRPAGSRAFELVARYDAIAFSADGSQEEEASGLLLGANWYLGRNIKIGVNYIHVSSDGMTAPGEPDDADVFGTRLQVAF